MTHKTPEEIAAEVASRPRFGTYTSSNTLGGAGFRRAIAVAAIEADRAQRDEARMLEKVRLYAEDRAAHARLPHLNTVGSGRIASDLFQILGLPYPHPEDLEEVEP